MAIEKVKVAARAAHPKVISTVDFQLNQLYLKGRATEQNGALLVAALANSSPQSSVLLERAPYPTYKVVVLNDEINTFQHVVDCLVKYIPAMGPDQAWALAQEIDSAGRAVVWAGPMEQAELYHMQLGAEGLTMAPLEQA